MAEEYGKPVVNQNDKEWFTGLTDKEKFLIVVFVNRCKNNNFALFDVFKVKQWQKKADIREHELVNELEQRNKDLSSLCIVCPYKNNTLTAERINELNLRVATLNEENRKLRERTG